MSKRLLASRVFNDTGDWFYYFVIVVIIYTMSKNPVMMGVLSASYTIPGILTSKKLANIINKLNDRISLITFDVLRVVVLIGIVLTNNVWIALICVFLEQIFAIGSNLSFQRVTLDVVQGKENLLKFNRHLKAFSNISRLLVIPSYLILHRFISNKAILGLDILFTIASLIETVRIKINHSKTLAENEISFKLRKLHFGRIMKMILVFSLLNVFRSFVDAYGIMYISDTSKNVSVGYAALVFILSVADLLGSFVSKNIVKNDNLNKNSMLTWSFVNILVLFAIPSMIHRMYCFIVVIFLIRLSLSVLELFVLYNVQTNVPNKIHQYTALQTMATDGISMINSIVGGFIIQRINIFNYMGIIILVTFFMGTILLKMKLYKK
ncbi:MAG TPA: hypothetical protein H9861_02075 [Candidatus Ligilactobacillus excrementigallinarum]|uniref:MFS transporter n=1 Tax=Candidatus Ligilactobacillus excrementigallinarum TaxID=2838641 RepID=A0A9D1UW31_9LACO|nr:hypothetical protein [Candidatus Ligilactobacillus excrementigallinarum]